MVPFRVCQDRGRLDLPELLGKDPRRLVVVVQRAVEVIGVGRGKESAGGARGGARRDGEFEQPSWYKIYFKVP